MTDSTTFKALADPTRRHLLDLLFEQDGQTLTELEQQLDMTRFGVAKHLKILEEAELITTRKIGRSRHHYLNTVPIQQLYERWVSKYSQPLAQLMTGLKDSLEGDHMSDDSTHVFQIYIRTTAEKLWQALTDGSLSPQYYFGAAVQSSWQVGEPYQYANPDGSVLVDGEIVEIDPPHKLVQTFTPRFMSNADTDPHTSRVTWEIEQLGQTCRLRLTHEELPTGMAGTIGISDGWARILSSLKSVLETGETLSFEVAQ